VNDPGAADLTPDPDRRGNHRRRNGDPAVKSPNRPRALIGFHCPVCGYLRPAEARRPVPAPLCAGSKARAGKQHDPTPMRALVLR
jgi:hypothetical protein